MSGGIYLLKDNDELLEMSEQAYDSEDLLQSLLEKYPDLLAGKQIDSIAPRRWLLIDREIGIPAQEHGSERWSVDHLFIDQDAIPTLVEVKRSSDSRIRREVVGQMLDYAANAVVYWPFEKIKASFESYCESREIDPDEHLSKFLEDELDPDEFWQRAKTNLQAGKVRLLFVADIIPEELQRIVEFLNEQMDPAEVLAVEIKQYVGQELKTLVPRVIGQTAEAKQRKTASKREKRKWDEASFFKELKSRATPEAVAAARRIYAWINEKNLRIWWGEGRISGSIYPMFDYKGESNWLFSLWTSGTVQLQFHVMKRNPAFADPAKRLSLVKRLNEIPGASIPESSIDRYPPIPFEILYSEENLNMFVAAFEWVMQETVSFNNNNATGS